MIKPEVRDLHLSKFPDEIRTIDRLFPDFEVTWAKREQLFNSELSFYFVKPRDRIIELFGIDQEILLVISDYKKTQARLMQAIDQFLAGLPAKGRVDQSVVLLISADSGIELWVRDYTSRHPQDRAYVGIYAEEIASNNDHWYLRNKLTDHLFSRDLFDYNLPLSSDAFFFGRVGIVANHVDAIKKSENRGIFGLRKTGKTSVLFKIGRQCKEVGIGTKYYDCKLPSLYRMSGDEFLDEICLDLSAAMNVGSQKWKTGRSAPDRFFKLIADMPASSRFCIMFDEVEYISQNNKLANHWSADFIPFWQSLWSAQSQFRTFCFIIAGVNASIVETDKVDGIQNPLFGIVQPYYLTGFERQDLESLLNVFGRSMGLNFDASAISMLFKRYGGHPLLSRMICSQLNTEMKVSGRKRPINIRSPNIESNMLNREENISFYCEHITSELELFHRDEYEMLEMLAVGNTVDFNDLAADRSLVRHLTSYGVLNLDKKHEPEFSIPVIKKYISARWRRENSQAAERYIVPPLGRATFVQSRLNSILKDMRAASAKFAGLGMKKLYEAGGPSEAELFVAISPCTDRASLVAFLNQANRSLIEPIDHVGKKGRFVNYFFSELNKEYPSLWFALNRVRSYRNHYLHLQLNDQARAHFERYKQEDFDGVDPENINDGPFRVQAAILDGLLISIQAELAKYD